jgi:PAS domain S-box-containing protein
MGNKVFLAHDDQASQYARCLIEASLNPLVNISPAGKIIDVNEETIKVTGISREHLLGTDFYNYFTDPEKAREEHKKVFDLGFVSDYPLTIRHKNGKIIDALFNASIYKDDNGNALGAVIVMRHVPDQKANELIIANKKLAFQNEEKDKRADELIIANKELLFQNEEKEKRADELIIANKELAFQNEEKEKRANELIIAYKELIFQNEEKEYRANELVIADKELAFQDKEKGKRADELIIADKELAFQDKEKGKRADELIIANKELVFQNEEKEKRAAELIIANKELVFQNEEKEKRAAELIIANKELVFQNEEKEKRATELIIANNEIIFQNNEREKREIAASELKAFNLSIQRASLYARSLLEAATDPLVTISPEGKITDVNEASVKVTGVSRDKLIGTDFSDYFTEPKKANEGYKQVFKKGLVSDYPLTICHKNGTLTDVLYNASVYKDDKGSVLGVFAAARDVTAQKKLERDVADREKELERLAELERFRKLTVGRELKMIELKKEIEELRRRLGDNQD